MMEECIAKKIKLLVPDVDGVLTAGTLYIGDSGEAFKGSNVKGRGGSSVFTST